MSTSDWIQIAILVVSIVSVIGTIIHSKKSIKAAIASTQASIDLTKEQIKAQMFTEYTRRYNDIILHMPKDSSEESVVEDSEMKRYMRLYFNLCSEEHHLWEKGMIDSNVWKLWEEGMQITMKNKRYVTAWKLLGGEYTDSDFVHFFQHEVIDWKNDEAATSNTSTEKKSRNAPFVQ